MDERKEVTTTRETTTATPTRETTTETRTVEHVEPEPKHETVTIETHTEG